MKKIIVLLSLMLSFIFVDTAFAITEIENEILTTLREKHTDYLIHFVEETKTFTIHLNKEGSNIIEESNSDSELGEELVQMFKDFSENTMSSLDRGYSLIIFNGNKKDEELLVIKDNEINKNALTSEGFGFSIFLDEVADYIDDFHPQDTSDETIKSIKTYNDYIVMYAKILEEYFISVEDVYKKMGTFNEEELNNLFNDTQKQIEDVKKSYGLHGYLPIVGKDELAEYLMRNRDYLNDYIERLKEAFGLE